VAVVTGLIENTAPARYTDERAWKAPDGRWVTTGGTRYARPVVALAGSIIPEYAHQFSFEVGLDGHTWASERKMDTTAKHRRGRLVESDDDPLAGL
jgi:hypothetical protein